MTILLLFSRGGLECKSRRPKGTWAMISLKAFSGTNLVSAALAIAALAFLPTPAAHADQFSYVFSGDVDGYLNGTSYSDVPITLTILENTSAIDNEGGGVYAYNGVDATLVTGSDTFTLNDVSLVVNGSSGVQSVGFYDSTATNGLGLSMVIPVGYNLASNLTVPETSSSSILTATAPPMYNGTFSDTNGDTLQFTANDSLGFTATDLTPPATPEPSSLLLLGSGVPMLALLRRRFVRA